MLRKVIFMYGQNPNRQVMSRSELTDYGPEPFVADIGHVAAQNQNFRTALWTGANLQVTLMSIPAGGEIGLELHTDVDQLLCIASGTGLAMMGLQKDLLKYDIGFVLRVGPRQGAVRFQRLPQGSGVSGHDMVFAVIHIDPGEDFGVFLLDSA
jgi:mannose-6-phosphate isomerase-like protein (cupin superfamily)